VGVGFETSCSDGTRARAAPRRPEARFRVIREDEIDFVTAADARAAALEYRQNRDRDRPAIPPASLVLVPGRSFADPDGNVVAVARRLAQ